MPGVLIHRGQVRMLGPEGTLESPSRRPWFPREQERLARHCPPPPRPARGLPPPHPPPRRGCMPPLLCSGPLLASCPSSFTAQHLETKPSSCTSSGPLSPQSNKRCRHLQGFRVRADRVPDTSRRLGSASARPDAGPGRPSQRPAPAGRPRPRRARLAGVKSRLRRRKAAGEGRPGRAPTSSPLRGARNVGTVPSAWYVCVNIVSLGSPTHCAFLISPYQLRPARVCEEDGDLASPPLRCIPRRPAS